MSRFYFHLQNDRSVVDSDGTDLADIAAAREHAYGVARELTFGRDGMLDRKWSDWTMSVRDERGSEVFSLTLAEVSEDETRS